MEINNNIYYCLQGISPTALINISEAKEHSSNNGFLCEEKQAIQTSNDINEAHEAFYKAILKTYK